MVWALVKWSWTALRPWQRRHAGPQGATGCVPVPSRAGRGHGDDGQQSAGRQMDMATAGDRH